MRCHEKTRALNLYEFWSVGKQGEHEAVRDLARFDTFCAPGGEWVEHVNETDGDAIFFVSSDEPVLKTLHFYVRHGRTEAGEEVLLESANRW